MQFKRKIEQRLSISLLVACTKMFPCGFFWQLMGFAVPEGPSRLLEFSLATGTGDAMGVFIGNLFLSMFLRYRENKITMLSMRDQYDGSFFAPVIRDCVVLGIGAFCSGGIWQPMLQLVSNSVESFTFGAICVGVSTRYACNQLPSSF